MKLEFLSIILLAGIVACTHSPTEEETWWAEQMALYRSARGVEIELYDAATSNSYSYAVTNEADLLPLRKALPDSYMKKARHLTDNELGHDISFIMVAYPYSGTLNTNGKAYPATCLFVRTDGLVFHGRGDIRDANNHGSMTQQYRDAAVGICIKHGTPMDKIRPFQAARSYAREDAAKPPH